MAKPDIKESSLAQQRFSQEEFLSLGHQAVDALTTLAWYAEGLPEEQDLCYRLGVVGLEIPQIRGDILGSLKRLVEAKMGISKLPPKVTQWMRSKIAELPDWKERGRPPGASEDPVETACFVHDLTNLLSGRLLREEGMDERIGLIVNVLGLNQRILEYSNREACPEEVKAPLRQVGTKAALAVDELLDKAGPEKLYPELYEARSIIHQIAGLPPVVEKVDLAEEINSFLSNRQFFDRNSQLPVLPTIEEEANLPPVWADRGDLYRTLRNLLNDVAAHGEKQGDFIPALISLAQREGEVVLLVANPGNLSEEELEKIGWQVYSTTGGREHGYGKISITKMFEALLRALKLDQADIQRILRDQWKVVRIKMGSSVRQAVSWQMNFFPA